MRSNKPLSRKKDLLTQETNGEIIVYDLNTDKAFCLNETSAIIWNLCNGENSVSEISAEIGKKLRSSANEDLVWLAIDQLKRDNLLANGEELENKSFEGLSRREVIKKVGLGTMIALPIVTGLITPKAIHASSTCSADPGNLNLCSCSTGSVNQQGQVCTPGGGLGNGCPAGCQTRFADNTSANCYCG